MGWQHVDAVFAACPWREGSRVYTCDTQINKEDDIDRDISLAKNDIDRDIPLALNDIDRYISLAKNYIDRDISLAKNGVTERVTCNRPTLSITCYAKDTFMSLPFSA